MQLSKMPDLQYSNTYRNILLLLNIAVNACSAQHKEHHTGDNFGVFLAPRWRCSYAHQLLSFQHLENSEILQCCHREIACCSHSGIYQETAYYSLGLQK